MGYGTRSNGKIQTYWPDDTDNDIYIGCTGYGVSLNDLMELVKEKWPGVSFDQISIEAENIHTDCLTYDLHDSGDYTQFIHIHREKD